MAAPVLPHILRAHAEQAAFLWTVYDRALLFPEENPEMDRCASTACWSGWRRISTGSTSLGAEG